MLYAITAHFPAFKQESDQEEDNEMDIEDNPPSFLTIEKVRDICNSAVNASSFHFTEVFQNGNPLSNANSISCIESCYLEIIS